MNIKIREAAELIKYILYDEDQMVIVPHYKITFLYATKVGL